MSLVTFVRIGKDKYQVFCPGCGVRVGVACMAEMAEWAKVPLVPYCFSCEPSGVDQVPRVLKSAEEVYCCVIGDTPFLCTWMDTVGDGSPWLSFVRINWMAWATMVSGGDVVIDPSLSSYTKLHNGHHLDQGASNE